MTLRLPTSMRDLSASGIGGLTMADHRASALLFNTSMQMRRRSCCCLACSGCQAPLHGVQVAAPALLRQGFCWDLLRSCGRPPRQSAHSFCTSRDVIWALGPPIPATRRLAMELRTPRRQR